MAQLNGYIVTAEHGDTYEFVQVFVDAVNEDDAKQEANRELNTNMKQGALAWNIRGADPAIVTFKDE